MAPGQPKFNACHFLWHEIIICSHTSSSGCHYAPYIFMMVKHATQLDLKTDVVHDSYKTSKGKLAQSFHLGKHTTGIDVRGSYPGIYTIDGPTDAGASSSQAPPTKARMIHSLWRVPLTLMGLLGVSEENSTFFQKACLLASTCSTKMLGSVRPIVGGWLKSFIGMRKIKKEMAASLNLPHSPVHEMQTFDPPSPVPNPWEDLGSWVPVGDE
jgi:hypothetical protein